MALELRRSCGTLADVEAVCGVVCGGREVGMGGQMAVELPVPVVADDPGLGTGGDAQVILYNDEVHSMPFVIGVLKRVFGHPAALARKIMLEAHRTGRAIAQVEPEPEAHRHAAQLRAVGFKADVERIG